MPALQDIKYLIGQNKLREALVSLESFLREDDVRLLLNRRFVDLREQVQEGVISTSEERLEKNRLAESLLSYVRDLEQNVEGLVDPSKPVSDQAYEQELWERAQRIRTVEAYEEYLRKSLLKLFFFEAFFAIEELEEFEAWSLASKTGTLAALQAFLNKYPGGKLAEKAKRKLKELQDIYLWEEAQRRHSISGYLTYLHDSDLLLHKEQAEAAVAKIKEQEAWEKAEKENNFLGYREYWESYPKGSHLVSPNLQHSPYEEEQFSLVWGRLIEARLKKLDLRYRPFFVIAGSTCMAVGILLGLWDDVSKVQSEIEAALLSQFLALPAYLLFGGMYAMAKLRKQLFKGYNNTAPERRAKSLVTKVHEARSRRVVWISISLSCILIAGALGLAFVGGQVTPSLIETNIQFILLYLFISGLWLEMGRNKVG